MATNRPHRRLSATRIGAFSWIAAVCVFVLANVAAQLAWKTPYSLRANNVSDLGNVRCAQTDPADNPPVRYICSPLHTVFNASAATAGVLIIVGTILTGALWRRALIAKITRALIAIGAGGYILAALCPADIDLNMHLLGALFIMGAGNIGLIVAVFALRNGPFPGLRVPTLILAALAVFGTILHFGQLDAGLGMGGSERIAIFALDAWLVLVAVAVLRADPARNACS